MVYRAKPTEGGILTPVPFTYINKKIKKYHLWYKCHLGDPCHNFKK